MMERLLFLSKISLKDGILKILAIFSTPFLLIASVAQAGWNDFAPRGINTAYNPGKVNGHYNSGGRRVVRINDTIIALTPTSGGSDQTFRSINNGSSWDQIDTDGRRSGCLISGPDEMVYHFYRNDDNIYMIRFRRNATPPSPTVIYSNPHLSDSGVGGVYSGIVNAIADRDGVLYVASHWGDPDHIYVIKSSDGGDTWSSAYRVSSMSPRGSWYYMHLDLTFNNDLVCSYTDFYNTGARQIMVARSDNGGEDWDNFEVSDEVTYNPSILPVGNNTLFLFAQSAESSHRGLVFKRSDDLGQTWPSNWTLIESTCGYADPSPALGADGNTIYVAFRSSNDTGLTSGTCGDRSRSKLTASYNLGQDWVDVDNHYNAERTGCRFQLRYQTFWNYGGPVEWIWLQFIDADQVPVYYDSNLDVQIHSVDRDTESPSRPTGLRIMD